MKVEPSQTNTLWTEPKLFWAKLNRIELKQVEYKRTERSSAKVEPILNKSCLSWSKPSKQNWVKPSRVEQNDIIQKSTHLLMNRA